jgi:uncharacterized glyoxalase superfamily protein PhnB
VRLLLSNVKGSRKNLFSAVFSKTPFRASDTLRVMNNQAKACRSTVIPAIRYRDALAAIDWLIRAFGFEKQAVYLGPDNITVMHAQLTFGNGMVMLGSATNDTEHSKFVVQPDEIGLRETQTPCLVVSDADAIYATAKAAGAAMVMDIADMPYGGRAFTCRDLEGHLWSIGTYDPWETEAPKSKP